MMFVYENVADNNAGKCSKTTIIITTIAGMAMGEPHYACLHTCKIQTTIKLQTSDSFANQTTVPTSQTTITATNMKHETARECSSSGNSNDNMQKQKQRNNVWQLARLGLTRNYKDK